MHAPAAVAASADLSELRKRNRLHEQEAEVMRPALCADEWAKRDVLTPFGETRSAQAKTDCSATLAANSEKWG